MSASGPSAEPDVHHGADQHAHHVVEEAVGLDVEAQPSTVGPRFPLGARETAAIVRLGLTLGGERPEVVLAEEQRGRGAERGGIERPAERPLEAPAERRRRRVVGTDVVAVAAARSRSCGRGSRVASDAPTRPSSPWEGGR